MPDSDPTWLQFQMLVQRILESKAFRIRKPESVASNPNFDFIASRGDQVWAVEVKFYRTERAQADLLERAASRLVQRGGFHNSRGVLIVSCSVPNPMKSSLENQYGVAVFDRGALLGWAASMPDLFDDLVAILEIGTVEEITEPIPELEESEPRRARQVDNTGSTLCQELHDLDRGKPNWRGYEDLCERILRYLFPRDLYGWHKQKRTEDGLNVFDCICRIRPTTEFWKFILDHLHSRYVLFEFKNYNRRITQGQVLTTEKYLLEKAFRRVAVIISRAGCHKSARAMIQGAMREHGKLILVLDDVQICLMLGMKERGDDPSDLLFNLIDNFLMSLPR